MFKWIQSRYMDTVKNKMQKTALFAPSFLPLLYLPFESNTFNSTRHCSVKDKMKCWPKHL